MDTLKICNRCGTAKLRREFYRTYGKCKACMLAAKRKRYHEEPEFRAKVLGQAREYFKASPEKFREYSRRRGKDPVFRERRRIYLKQWRRSKRYEALCHYSKLDHPACACCGEELLEFLCLDHVRGGGGQHRAKSRYRGEIFHELRIEGYPEGYRVLCCNCNMSLGLYGYCPHDKRRA